MAYPGRPTHRINHDYLIDEPLFIKAGDQFIIEGYLYKATSDMKRLPGARLSCAALRYNPAVPSRWELSHVLEPEGLCFYEPEEEQE